MCFERGEIKVTPEIDVAILRGDPISDSLVFEASTRKSAKRFVASVPLPWIGAAIQLPGKCLHVAVVVWYYWKLTKKRPVALSHRRTKHFGIHHQTVRSALKRLEAAGLISVQQRGKQSPRVTVHENGGTDGGQDE